MKPEYCGSIMGGNLMNTYVIVMFVYYLIILFIPTKIHRYIREKFNSFLIIVSLDFLYIHVPFFLFTLNYCYNYLIIKLIPLFLLVSYLVIILIINFKQKKE